MCGDKMAYSMESQCFTTVKSHSLINICLGVQRLNKIVPNNNLFPKCMPFFHVCTTSEFIHCRIIAGKFHDLHKSHIEIYTKYQDCPS